MHSNKQNFLLTNSVGVDSGWYVFLPVVLCFVVFCSGCGQQRYQPAKWRPGLRQWDSKAGEAMAQTTDWSTLPVRGNTWGTLPSRNGSTLPRRGGTLPFRSWSTLPNSTLPNRGGMSTLPSRNWGGSTLPQRQWERRPIPGMSTLPQRQWEWRPIPGMSTLPRMNTLPRRTPVINFNG